MRSFQQIVVALFALLVCVFAQSAVSDNYDATVYVTSTVYRVNTVTLASSPTGSVANQTSTIAASHPSAAYPTYAAGNGTSVVAPSGYPSGTQAQPSSPQFTGAASVMNVNVFVAALAAGVGYLAL